MANAVRNQQDDWKSHLLNSGEAIQALLQNARRIAVLGIKPESHDDRPAFFVPAYAKGAGYEIIPVPVYYPEVTEILGEKVHRSLSTIDPPPDMVQLFRRSSDVPKHVDEILAAKPKVVWMQLGIRNDEAAEKFARAGITVVQDRCMKIEMERLGR